MKPSIPPIFQSFSTQFEGLVPWMYLDIKGLVTTGIGNLIDPVENALCLPFYHETTGVFATQSEITFEWRSLKLNKSLAQQGHLAAQKATKLRISREAISELCNTKLSIFENYLKVHHFKDFDLFPADAQLGILSMAWAMGPAFPKKFPIFTNHCNVRYWAAAAKECKINSTGNPGVIPRNKANQKLFNSAQYCVENSLNPENLYGLQNLGILQSQSPI